MKKTLLFLVLVTMVLSGCRWVQEPPPVGQMLAKRLNNKLYNKFDTAKYNAVFVKVLDSSRNQFLNPNTLKAFYVAKGLEPVLIMNSFTTGGLDTLRAYIAQSDSHGFSPANFRYKSLDSMLTVLRANKFKTVEEVYPVVASLELNAAEALLRYHNFIYYGALNPRKVLSKYQIKVRRPDSLSIIKVLETSDMAGLLRDIQPKSIDYKVFQSELTRLEKKGVAEKLLDSNAKASLMQTLLVNMERLRWKLPEKGKEYIQVNVPDFTLTWFDGPDTLSYMKVCVGEKREEGFEEKVKLYLETGKLEDKPRNHQTPMLFGKLNSIQVNPIWNIPVSIARSEIYYLAQRDRYYLSNNNIRVYYKDQLVGNPDTIQWHKYKREKLPFKFKQGSGEGNALGKFKFIFDASSSIYLHDTNNKTAFRRADRAISHGCVRVERPLEFAENLVIDKYQYDQLRMEVSLPPVDTTRMAVYKKKLAKKADTVNLFQLKPSWFAVKRPVPLILNYITAWVEQGNIQYRADIYGHDEALWKALRKFN